MKPKIAILSFMPDTGHIVPLLRLAVSIREQQYEVQVFLPDECASLTEEFAIPACFFGKVTACANPQVFEQLSQRSIYYNAFSCFQEVTLQYFQPIEQVVAAKIERLKALLEEYRPGLIIADYFHNPLLKDYYFYLAGYLKKTIVFHDCGGNYRYKNYHDGVDHQIIFHIGRKCFHYHYERFLYNYGFTNLPRYLQTKIMEYGEKLDQKYQLTLGGELARIREKKEENHGSNLQKVFPGAPIDQVHPLYISTGLPFIEKKATQNYFPGRSDLWLFPPVKDQRKSEIQPELRRWLEAAGDKPVVYICLGTMVYSNPRLIRKILRGLKGLKIYILWAAPFSQQKMIRAFSRLPNLRIEEYVPQPKILALKRVRCFITHGGAGGIQDSLLNGKPMLCIPFMFDQPFNSSVVELLQAGIKIWKHRVTVFAIRKSVRRLLDDPKYWNAAQNQMKELQNRDGGMEVIRFLEDMKLLKDSE